MELPPFHMFQNDQGHTVKRSWSVWNENRPFFYSFQIEQGLIKKLNSDFEHQNSSLLSTVWSRFIWNCFYFTKKSNMVHMGLLLHSETIFGIPIILKLFTSCNPSLYSLYNSLHTEHTRSFLSDNYLFFPTPISFFIFLLSIFFIIIVILSNFRFFDQYLQSTEPVSFWERAMNANYKVNGALLVQFVEAIEMKEFCAHFNIGGLYVKQFQKWIMSQTPFQRRNCGRDES